MTTNYIEISITKSFTKTTIEVEETEQPIDKARDRIIIGWVFSVRNTSKISKLSVISNYAEFFVKVK